MKTGRGDVSEDEDGMRTRELERGRNTGLKRVCRGVGGREMVKEE